MLTFQLLETTSKKLYRKTWIILYNKQFSKNIYYKLRLRELEAYRRNSSNVTYVTGIVM